MRLILLGHSANDLFWFILPLVLPFLLERYDLSYTQAGGILTVYLAVTAVGSFAMGKLSDRLSPRKIMGAGFLVAAFGLASSGFSPGLGLFLVLVSITAVGVSTFHPVMYAIIDRRSGGDKGRFLGLYESFGIGAILIMFLVNGLLFKWIGIRGVMLATALPAAVMGILYLRSSDGAFAPARSGPEEGSDEPGSAAAGASAAGGAVADISDGRSLRRFALFLLSVVLRIMSVAAITNFLPTIFVRHFGFDSSAAAYGSAFYFAGGIAGSLAVGRISGRSNPFVVLGLGSVLIAAVIALLNVGLPKPAYPAAVALFGFLGSGCVINQNLLTARLGGRLGKGEAFGLMMGAGTITSAVSPSLFGMAVDSGGFGRAFLLFTLPVALSLVLLGSLAATDRPARPAAQPAR